MRFSQLWRVFYLAGARASCKSFGKGGKDRSLRHDLSFTRSRVTVLSSPSAHYLIAVFSGRLAYIRNLMARLAVHELPLPHGPGSGRTAGKGIKARQRPPTSTARIKVRTQGRTASRRMSKLAGAKDASMEHGLALNHSAIFWPRAKSNVSQTKISIVYEIHPYMDPRCLACNHTLHGSNHPGDLP